MKISSINSYNSTSQISHKGGVKSLNIINPISYYLDNYFNKVAKASMTNIEPITPKLAPNTKFLKLGRLSAWDINPSNTDKYVLFLHGMSQNVSNYQRLYEAIADKDKAIFALEYRGYGANNSAKISEDKLRKDVKKAYDYLVNKKQIKPENITVMGHSMGGALATDFASKHEDLRALVLISPICKASYLGKKFMQNKNLGLGIPPVLQSITEKLKPLYSLLALRFNAITKMKKNSVPTYILHSTNDSVTSVDGTRALIKAARRSGALKEFEYLPYGGHKVDSSKVKAVSAFIDDIYK